MLESQSPSTDGFRPARRSAMKSRPSGRRLLACLAALLAACVPMFFSACGGGMLAPASNSQQNAAHAITSIVPNSGSPGGGSTVTITGTDFTSGSSVSFGGVPASKVSFVSSTQLKATTPAHSSGAVSVAVTNPDGSSADLPNGFTYTSTALTVSGVSPASGPAAGGTAVTITGTGFDSGTSVSIGGLTPTSVTVTNSTTIQAVTPTHSFGTVSVTVTTSGGQSASQASGFTYHAISLIWSAPSSTPSTITGYDVYRAQVSNGPFARVSGSLPLPETSFSDPTVQSSTTYYYEVTSVDTNGVESSPDGPVAVTTGP